MVEHRIPNPRVPGSSPGAPAIFLRKKRMVKQFDSQILIQQIFKDIVHKFDNSSAAGTPGLIGHAKESAAQRQLEKLLPGTVAIGSGLIVDSNNTVSKQQDIVIYEKDFCPVFAINDTPETTFYPCEGVISVGEVKSTIGTKELEDSFKKIASVKRCKRHLKASKGPIALEPTIAYRNYGTSMAMEGTKAEELNPQDKELDQIWGFILCENFGLQAETLLQKSSQLWKKYQAYEAPNMIISLNNGFIQLGSISDGKSALSAMNAEDVLYFEQSDVGFSLLIRRLNFMIRNGRTSEIGSFNRYFTDRNNKQMQATLGYNLNSDKITKF